MESKDFMKDLLSRRIANEPSYSDPLYPAPRSDYAPIAAELDAMADAYWPDPEAIRFRLRQIAAQLKTP